MKKIMIISLLYACVMLTKIDATQDVRVLSSPTLPNKMVHKADAAFSLQATFSIDNEWPSGYQVTVTLRNTTQNATSSWQASFTLPIGYAVTNIWNGIKTTNGITILVSNPSWIGGGVIQPNSATTFGMVISKPFNASSILNNLMATANGTVKPTVPQAPVLNPISINAGSSNYTVTWNGVSGATSYTLQESTSNTFANPVVVLQGIALSKDFTNKSNGTYYYRVAASNENGMGMYSNMQQVTVNTTQPPPPTTSSWIIDGYWESWAPQNPSIDAIVAMKVDVLNISFANFMTTGSHTYKIAGVESDPKPLINAAHNLGKKVKIAVGGATYPLQGQLQTDADAQGMAQAVVDYINSNNLDGVDWDIEDYPSAPLQVALLKYTRALLGPNKLQTYTPKSPASSTYPYNEVLKNGHQHIDYLSIMAYDYAPGYRYQDDVKALIAMGIPASKIVVGLLPGPDDLGVMTSLADIQTAANFIKSNNLKGIMFWDLNRDYLNITGLGPSAATNTAWTIFHS